MKLRLVASPRRTEASAIGIAQDGMRRTGTAPSGVGWSYLRAQGFKGELGQCVAAPDANGKPVLHVGMGPSAAIDPTVLCSAAAVAARSAGRSRTLTLALASAGSVPADRAAAAQGEGVVLGAYRYAGRRTIPGDQRLEEVHVVATDGHADPELRSALARGARRAEATCLARDLVNEPGGDLTAVAFAARAREVAEAAGLRCTVHDEKALRRLGFGGLLAVNRGSTVPPRFVELAYDPAGKPADTVVALVGKGVTFDSGGLSLKTAEGMTTMKCDMAGGAAVLAAMTACRDLDVDVGVRGYIPLTDNMLGGDAQRVGDVVTHYGGSTTEVLNTDAEGRLLLADALAYATEERAKQPAPAAVLDIATLTGACMVALGTRTAGLFGNDDVLVDHLLRSAAACGERIWRLPLVEGERKGLESKVADRRNVGTGRYGGAIVAALYLRDFVREGTPWAHLDIAGPAYNDGSDELEHPSGGTGFGVRTLLTALESWTDGALGGDGTDEGDG